MIRLSFALLFLATPAFADRLTASATCAPTDMALHYRCDIVLTSADTAVSGAAFTVKPDMPSMPMAHNIAPVDAVETATPGTYATDLRLDMLGDWTLTLDFSAPRRDRVVLSHSFGEGASAAHAHGTSD